MYYNKSRNRVFFLAHATLMPLNFLDGSSQEFRGLDQIAESLKSFMDADSTKG